MTTAFVLSGGASLGAVQVGMLAALDEAGIRPDMLIGTSVGALNAAYVAGHPGPGGIAGLDTIWRHIRRRDVFPAQPVSGLLGFSGRSNHLVPDSGLRRLIEANLTYERLEEATIPVHVVATEVTTGAEVVLSSGPALPAVLASAAIPGVFAPQRIDGRVLMDGGIADNTPVSRAVALGADRLYVLSASFPCALPEPPPTALGMVVHAITVLIEKHLAFDVERFEQEVDLRVVPPLCPLTVSPVDFRRSGELIDRARVSTAEWLKAGRPGPGQASMLTPHPH
jgi:NTE family protein